MFKVKNKKENDITYRFTNQQPANIGRKHRANIITGPQGVKAKARNTESPRSAFELSFTLDMVHNIVIYTNYKINQTLDTMTPDFFAQNNLGTVIKECMVIEMSAFIGLILCRGLWKQNTFSINNTPPLNELGPPISEKRMRCHMCMLEIAAKSKRLNKDNVNCLKSLCQLCGTHRCRNHLIQKCAECQ